MPETPAAKTARSSESDVLGSLPCHSKLPGHKRTNAYSNRKASYPGNNCKTDGQARGCGRRHDRDDDDANPKGGRWTGGNGGRQWSTRSGTGAGGSRDASGKNQSYGGNTSNSGNYYC